MADIYGDPANEFVDEKKMKVPVEIHTVCGVWDMRYGTISNFGKFGGTVDINIPRSMGQSFNLMKEHSLSFCKIRETD